MHEYCSFLNHSLSTGHTHAQNSGLSLQLNTEAVAAVKVLSPVVKIELE